MGESRFRIAVVGLGLIGGSFAYALHGFKSCAIAGYDINRDAASDALAAGAIHEAASSAEEAVRGADIALFCTAPDAAVDNARRCVGAYKNGAVAVEICGVKQGISRAMRAALPSHVRYVGLHPMAGKEVGGFQNASADLFKGAGFIIIEGTEGAAKDAAGQDRVEKGATEQDRVEKGTAGQDAAEALVADMCRHVGAGRICRNNAADHDRIIAYTSDLMHIAATALCAEYPSDMTMAHTAGAFRDSTRVAKIDATLWTELFTKNAQCILPHLDTFIGSLSGFRDSLARGDSARLHRFLETACENKTRMLTL